ncbi:MAG TPA: hypothetical protein VG407_13350 [Caulobacteraceae bacterium]|jgi:hypothetical protein|nr:hypothetical protein [Caulobacteraceae bacterium]
MGIARRLTSKTVWIFALAAALTPVAASAASAIDLYYDRELMTAADNRCRLFAPQIGAALEASANQARGAALRAGVDGATVNGVTTRANQKAVSVDCASPDLKLAAQRVRTAFEGWSRTAHMDFPGETAPWRADRMSYRSITWRLVQTAYDGSDPVLFGLAGENNATGLIAVAAFPNGERPYAARLVYRDGNKTHSAWVGAPKSRPLPPRWASSVVMAEDVEDASAVLTPRGRDHAIAFRFPAATLDALSALDPRERFAVEFLFAGDHVRTAAFEVGDLAAGRAFLKLGPL